MPGRDRYRTVSPALVRCCLHQVQVRHTPGLQQRWRNASGQKGRTRYFAVPGGAQNVCPNDPGTTGSPQDVVPGRDGVLVPLGHHQVRYFRLGELPDLLVLDRQHRVRGVVGGPLGNIWWIQAHVETSVPASSPAARRIRRPRKPSASWSRRWTRRCTPEADPPGCGAPRDWVVRLATPRHGVIVC